MEARPPEIPFTSQEYETEASPEKKSRTGLIIGIVAGVVLLILCCCCIIALVLVTQWESISRALGG